MRIPVYLTLAAALPLGATHACTAPGAETALAGGLPPAAPVRPTPDERAASDTAPRLAADTTPSLVAVVYLRRDEIEGELRPELHPLAFIDDGDFRDGTWPSVEEGGEVGPEIYMLPAGARHFVIYEQGVEIGRMNVDSVALASYACLELPVGLGRLDFELPYGAFDETDARVDRYSGWVDGESEDYSLRYFVALSRSVPQSRYVVDTLQAAAAVRRLRDAITRTGADTLRRLDLSYLRAEERGRSEPRLEELRLVDLDRDGVVEAVGRVGLEVELHFDYYEGDATDAYRLTTIVWMRDRGPDLPPELLGLRADTQAPDSWGEGWELVEVLDLTGDGQAEVVYEWSGYESNSFHIFRLTDGRLEEAFGGGGHGC